MRVELLFWDADPEYMTARQRLVEVLIGTRSRRRSR
jgi:hypothetical protein